MGHKARFEQKQLTKKIAQYARLNKIALSEALSLFRANKKDLTSELYLQKYANKLIDNLPKSEVWFRSIWDKEKFNTGDPIRDDFFNYPTGPFIPDVINFHYKYLIEIDGSIHTLERQKKRDAQKDAFFRERGFTVFRVWQGDIKSLQKVIASCRNIRNLKDGTSCLRLAGNGVE